MALMIPQALTLRRLRIFMTVVEQGSFNRAAQQLLLSQAAVSQQISGLENGLAVVLFDRGPQGVTPTAAGHLLYEHGQAIFATVAAAEQDLVRLTLKHDQRLALAATSGISVYILPPWLRRFQEAYPNVSLSLQTGLTRGVADLVLQEQVDFAFVAGGLNDLDNGKLGRRTLLSIQYHLIVPPDHPWAGQKTISPELLAGVPFLDRQPHSRTRRWLSDRLATAGIALQTTTELDSPDMVKAGVLSGLGVSILPDYVIAKEVAREDLVPVGIAGVSLDRPLELLWHRRRKKTLVQRQFEDVLSSKS